MSDLWAGAAAVGGMGGRSGAGCDAPTALPWTGVGSRTDAPFILKTCFLRDLNVNSAVVASLSRAPPGSGFVRGFSGGRGVPELLAPQRVGVMPCG